MRVTLVQPALARHDTSELTPPLGLLMLAAMLEGESFDVSLVDLNLAGLEDPDWNGLDAVTFAVRAIAATEPDVVGFTSMALEAHFCLDIAARLKAVDPALRIVLGGPQFSATADAILETFECIDCVVLGEGERTFTELCRRLRTSGAPGRLPNLAHRGCLASHAGRQFKPHDSLDQLPGPAYHLVELERYFALNPLRMVSIEHARGCALRCAYCYSPVHWGQGEQRRTIERVQQEMETLHAAGARRFFFVSDNFLNSKPAAMALAAGITELGLDLHWNGYATLAQITPEIAATLSRSGCRALFVGVDAITEGHKRRFKKHYFRGRDDLSMRLEACVDNGIVPTCAFLVEHPFENTADVDETLAVAAFTRTLGCNVTLNPLTVYSGTPVCETAPALSYSDAKPKLLFDTHPFNQENALARVRPELFPCHNTVHSAAIEHELCATVYCAHALIKTYPWTLIRHAADDGGSIWDLAHGVAERCGTLTDIPAPRRRDVVRDTFAEQSLNDEALAGLRPFAAYEASERQLVGSRPKRVVTSADRADRRELMPYRVVSLAVAPTQLLAYDKLDPSEIDDIESPYLMVARPARIDYFAIPRDLADRLPAFEDVEGFFEGDSGLTNRVVSEEELTMILDQFGIIGRSAAT